MAELRYHTAGESHGPGLVVLVQGLPAGLDLDVGFIDAELARRQGGYGRGGRQRIERDAVTFTAGVRRDRTIGAPLVMQIPNRDSRLDDDERTPPVHRPRPGHADLAGSVKWLTIDCRETLERASARETASKVAAGAVARLLLRAVGIETFGFVRSIHEIESAVVVAPETLDGLRRLRDESEVYCPDSDASAEMVAAIRAAKVEKDTVGGVVECHVVGCPIGLGSCMNWSEKLDSRIAAAVLGIQAFKGVEIGLGFDAARRRGSEVHDPIGLDHARAAGGDPALGFVRERNHAGGLEGGMTNGQPVVVRGAMKPISTLLRGMPSVNLRTRQPERSQYERSDICAVSAASVVLEHVVAFEIAAALRTKFGGDSMAEVGAQYDAYLDLARRLPLEDPGLSDHDHRPKG